MSILKVFILNDATKASDGCAQRWMKDNISDCNSQMKSGGKYGLNLLEYSLKSSIKEIRMTGDQSQDRSH